MVDDEAPVVLFTELLTVSICLFVCPSIYLYVCICMCVCLSDCLLVRERSALSDPYCHSACNSVCVSATLRSNISKTKGASG